MDEDTKYIERLTAAEERAKSNSHRLDTLEKTFDAIHKQGETLAVICEQLKQQGATLKLQGDRLTLLEKKPADRWESMVSTIITVVVTAVASGALTAIATLAATHVLM